MTNSTALNLDEKLNLAKSALNEAGQAHVLEHINDLTPDQQETFLNQILAIDWPEITKLIATYVKQKPGFKLPQNIKPAPAYPPTPTTQNKSKYKKAQKLGTQLISESKVALFTVAGGQGTRLGFNGPKGAFPATPIRNISIFSLLAQTIQKNQDKYSCQIPWYIMTSPANHSQTVEYFEQNGYFGLDPQNVTCFPQAMMPAIDPANGRALLQAKDSLALSPNGHGGSLKALHTSGAIADMKTRGITQISYTQIDNPLVKAIDPLFIGLHALDNCQMSSKMLPKAYAKEKLGNFCLVDDKITIIEYSDLPDELAQQTNEDGSLVFRAGSIAIHLIAVDFVDSLNQEGFGLPWHRADKKVPSLDNPNPTEPNAVKLETFVFDALPLCENSIIYETDRIEEFAPIKNADAPDAVDCPQTSKQIQSQRAARWLEANGVKIPYDTNNNVDAIIEITPKTAVQPDDLKKIELPEKIEQGTQVLL